LRGRTNRSHRARTVRRLKSDVSPSELPAHRDRRPGLGELLDQAASAPSEQVANQRGEIGAAEATAIEQHAVRSLGLRTGDTLLEIGCGTGLLSAAAAPHCRRVTSIDVSAGLLRRAQANVSQFPNVALVRADAVRLPLLEHTVDRVLLYNVILYFGLEELDAVLAEVRRVLRPGGLLLVGDVPNPGRRLHHLVRYQGLPIAHALSSYSLFAAKRVLKRILRLDQRSWGWYAPAELRRVAARHGFTFRLLPQSDDLPFHYWRYDAQLTLSD
jgi:ubiquinone/menaquinone biosynthesis C-methylase UbiE